MVEAATPVMRQYARWKNAHPGALLFFRMGDFYELFHEDAKEASRLLDLTLTSRGDGIPMAGVPVRAAQTYLRRLMDIGRSVAVCEQIEDPKQAKGIVDRAVVRVLTPGTLTEDGDLDRARNNYLLAVAPGRDARGRDVTGLAWVDLSTGAFEVAEIADPAQVADELARIEPSEVLVARMRLDAAAPLAAAVLPALRGEPRDVPEWWFDEAEARRALREHFGVADLGGFGLDDLGPALAAAGAALQYLGETQRTALPHLRPPRVREASSHLLIDRVTLRCLEVVANQRDGGREGTLLSVVDRSRTAMGARLLRAWLAAPLRAIDAIRARHDAVEELVANREVREAVRAALDTVQDLERLTARVATERASPRDLVALAKSLAQVTPLRDALAPCATALLREAALRADPVEEVRAEIARTLRDDAPIVTNEGGIVREGRDADLDALRGLASDAQRYLADLQAREIARTGIPTLRVGFTSVFGYYIEVTRAQVAKVPDDYQRRQTLKNVERYVTPELKEWEAKLLTADERARALEQRIFVATREAAAREVRRLQQTAAALAEIDALASLAEVAADRGWTRPEVDDGARLEIRQGRHPVLEVGRTEEPFVPNDADLDGGGRAVGILTGPNMAGKSTYIRQVALLAVLAQAGSFVPAASARIGVVDRVFARVGASDDLSRGRSTFMVEMMETANILHHATDRSLIVLDEVGRGTSTYDGVALAWAITEHLALVVRARTLFATHYHELTALPETSPELAARVRTLRVAVREWGDRVVFLHRIEDGGTDRSYGVHVARLAGLPPAVLDRATSVLARLEEGRTPPVTSEVQAAIVAETPPRAATRQLPLFAPPAHPVLAELRALDPERTTPRR